MSKDVGHSEMVINPATLEQLPASVAALVHDYATGDKQQYWRLCDLEFDAKTLDALPIGESSTCEIFSTTNWIWYGRTGKLSLSPFLVRPDAQLSSEADAWIVERENESGHERITVWRIRVQQQEDWHEHAQTQSPVSSVSLQPVNEQQCFEIVRTFQRKHDLEGVQHVIEEAFGTPLQTVHVVLQGGDLYLGGSLAYRHMDRIAVFDRDENEIPPDFNLPFWQKQSSLDTILAQPGEEDYNDEIEAYEDPAEGSKEYHIAAVLEELIHAECGFLPAEEKLKFDMASEETQKLLHLQFPSLFIQ